MIHGDVDSANVLLWGEDEHWIAKLGYYEITNLRQEYMTVNQGESNDLLALEAPIASQVESTKVKLLVLFPFLSMLLSDHDTNGVKGVKNA